MNPRGIGIPADGTLARKPMPHILFVIRHSSFVISRYTAIMRSPWKRFRYRLEWLGLLIATKLVPLLPRESCLRLAKALGWLMSIFDWHGRKVALSNLNAAFGEELSIGERRRIARQSFQHFGRTMLDLLWSPRLTRENFSRYIELENFEETARGTGPEHSMIIACYHYGNFEWLSLACGFLGLTGRIISQEFKNSLLDPIFRNIRELSGHELIPRERGIIRLYKVLRRKGRTALLVDLTVPPSQGAVAIDCFGLKTSVTSAHAWLNQQTGVPIIPAHCEPLPDGRYRLVFHPKIVNTVSMTHQQIAQACWNSFEPYVCKNPAPWLWMYKHWRYLPEKPDRPYPFYSKHSMPFNEMLPEATAVPHATVAAEAPELADG
jgi:Kdo2-lipid IVA lauroyltransferase/acyltransferase